jgi:hypothetical protein
MIIPASAHAEMSRGQGQAAAGWEAGRSVGGGGEWSLAGVEIRVQLADVGEEGIFLRWLWRGLGGMMSVSGTHLTRTRRDDEGEGSLDIDDKVEDEEASVDIDGMRRPCGFGS